MVGAVACAVTLAVAVAVALAGCAVLGPATSPRAQPVPRHAIRIDGWDGFEQTLLYHDALVFVDAEADKAAREDGHEGGAPNPIWIRDLPSRGQLAIDPNVSVILVGLDATGSRVPKLVPVRAAARAPPGSRRAVRVEPARVGLRRRRGRADHRARGGHDALSGRPQETAGRLAA